MELTSSPYVASLRLPFTQTLSSVSPLFQLDNTGTGQDAVFAGRVDFGTAANNGDVRVFRNGVGIEELCGYTSSLGGNLELHDEAGNTTVQLAPDGDGTGGFAGSGEPGFQITGSARSCYLTMSNSGDASVTLPADAISSLETFDEAGVASDNGTSTVVMDGTVQTIPSRTITVPGDGYCLVIASGQVTVAHTNGSASSGTFGVSAASGAFPGTRDLPVQLPSAAATGTYVFPVTVHGLFNVTAGPHNFYFLGQESLGALTHSDRQLSVVFLPTA